MMTKATITLKKSPYRNLLWLTVKKRPEKSGLPNSAAMIGVIKSLTKPVTTAPKAMPMTMPTAMSTRLPLSKKVLKPLPIPPSPFIFAACLTCNASLISPSPLFSRHRLIWGPAAGRIDKTQELALAAPQELDHRLPLGRRLLVVEGRSGKFGDGSVQVGKLK